MGVNDETQIINTFNDKKELDNFSVVVSYKDIQAKNFNLNAGQFFGVKVKYVNITQREFQEKVKRFNKNIEKLSNQSDELETKIKKKLKKLSYK